MKIRTFDKTLIEVGDVKPCPFCGERDLEITPERMYKSLCEENGSSLIEIECTICDTSMKVFNIPDNNYHMGVGILIERWNRRTK